MKAVFWLTMCLALLLVLVLLTLRDNATARSKRLTNRT